MTFLKELTIIPPFKNLTVEQIGNISKSFQPVQYPVNSYLITQGRKVEHIGFIVKGSADLKVKIQPENDIYVGIIKEGEFFGILSFPGEDLSMVSVVSKEPVVCYLQPIKEFQKMLENYYTIKDFFYNITIERIFKAYQKLKGINVLFDGIPTVFEQKQDTIQKSIYYIDQNFMNQLTLGEVAREIGMSKYHFSRIFKAKTGTSFKEYLNKKRIETAKQLMAGHNMNVSEACFSTGFNDVSYFSRIFRKYEHITPSSYRKDFMG